MPGSPHGWKFANPEPEVAAPSEDRTEAAKRARQDEVGPPRESATARLELTWICDREALANDRVCGLDVCDELDESDTHVNDCEGDYTDEVTGVTLLRDAVATARTEEMAWYEKFEASEEVTGESCLSRTGRKPIFFSMEIHPQK